MDTKKIIAGILLWMIIGQGATAQPDSGRIGIMSGSGLTSWRGRLPQAVDDHHGWLAVGNTTLRWERAEPPFLSRALKNELAKGGRIVRKMLPGGIGYLRVTGRMVGLADSLARLEAGGARKLIVDLRLAAGEYPCAVPRLHTRTPVVVLTGHGTGSAGESIAVAFKGRKHTLFIR